MNKKFLLILLNIFSFLTLWAADDKWDFNPYDYQYDMTVYAALNVDGATASDLSGYSVAAFCGDECRGIAKVMKANDDEYLYLRIRSNQQGGEQISFKVLDNNTDRLLKCCTTLQFQAESVIGMPSSPMTIEAANSYKLVYKIGDEEISSEEVYYGETLPTLEAPEKEGYTFAGWQDVPETMPAHDVTIIGSYDINSYTLTFKIGNDVISESKVDYGSEIVEPNAPEKEGYVFGGWEEHPQTMPAHDLTINGYYEGSGFTLTYEIDGEVVSQSKIEFGTILTPIEAPEKEGYTFNGWVGLPETMPAHDVTVTGSYTINSYTLTFKIGNDVISESSVEYGSQIVEPQAPEKEGYVFGGWEEHPQTMPAHDLTINGYYEGDSFTLTYILDGVTISQTKVDFGAAITAIEAPEKEGYTFTGWIGLPETMPAHDVTVTGSYTINSYTLSFKIGDDVISESVVEYGSQIVEPQAPEKEGYVFAGWDEHPQTMPAHDLTINGYYEGDSFTLTYVLDGVTISQTKVDFGTALTAIEAPEKEGYTFSGWVGLPETMPAHDVTVTGSYTINSYTLTFKIGNDVISESVVEYGSQIVEPQAPEKEGYVFAGWDEHPQTMPAHDLTINGYYECDSFTLTYVLDGVVIFQNNVEFGTTLTPIEAPAKEGYTFNGWVGLPESMPAHDVVVTGSYTINSYTLTFKIGDDVISESTVEYGSQIIEPQAPEKEGYVFGGWEEHPQTMPAHNLTINGYYQGDSFTLTYVIDGLTISQSEVEYGTTLTAIEAPEKEGYTFNGWVGLPEAMPAHDVVVYGTYSINSYKLTFKIGDEVISESTVEYGSTIVEPNVPDKEGFVFAGWEEHPVTMPAHDLVIKGYYEGNSFTLSYVIDGVVVYESRLEFGAAITPIEAPEKEGYTFNGWEGLPETMPAHDVRVTGSYSVNSYRLVFLIGDEVISESTVEYGSKIEEPTAPQKEGYTFTGWSEVPQTMPSHDVTITGSYTINSYKLTFKIGNDVISESMVEYGSEIVAPEAPEKEGYKFDGWDEYPQTMPAKDLVINGHYEGCGYALTYVIDGVVVSESIIEYGTILTSIEAPEKEGYTFNGWVGLPETMPAEDVTVTGSYTINSYKLTFIIGEDVISESTVEYASSIVAPEAPQKEGYTFSGWQDMPETMPAKDLTITGSYTINTYKLTFIIGNEVIAEETVEYASTIVAPEAPEKEGYTFEGWKDVPETMPAQDLTITGSYAVNKYVLTYIIDDEIVYEAEVEYGSKIDPIEAPEKEGYTFEGWTNVPQTMPAEDVTIQGSYKVNTYTVTYMLEDGTVVRVDEVEYGAALPEAPEAPEKEDYTFKGWKDVPQTMPAEDIVIVGSYEYETGLSSIYEDAKEVIVYDLRGNLIKMNGQKLASGVYIVNGQKVLIK